METNTNIIEERQSETDRRVGEVFQTMLIFTTFMVLAPISTYFMSKKYLFEGKWYTCFLIS